MTTNDSAPLLAQVHHAFMDPLLRLGRAPGTVEVAERLGLGPDEVAAVLGQLAANHGVVLHPHSHEPWIMHPFSLSPTATWVEHGALGWWAPCLWCAFGVAGLAGGTAVIHTRLGGEHKGAVIDMVEGEITQESLVVHFSIPPRDAWNNVHHFCATVLAFEHSSDVPGWCERHALPFGAVAPIQSIANLGRQWYARHCDPDWRKWTGAQAGAIFDDAGLTAPFWQFDRSERPF
jgi:hypothetical protein